MARNKRNYKINEKKGCITFRNNLKLDPTFKFLLEGNRLKPDNWFARLFWRFIKVKIVEETKVNQLITRGKMDIVPYDYNTPLTLPTDN